MVANAIVTREIAIATPKRDTSFLLRRANEILHLKRKFKKEVHYGAPYPGSKKDTLLKPGAELLAAHFGIRPRYDVMDKVLQINPANLSESVIIYVYRCEMVDIQSGLVVGEAIGACSSLEDKYRQRKAERVCPKCDKATIIKGKEEYGGGWICFAKKGGCGAKFKDGDKTIEEQPEGVTLNQNPVNELNTIIKMAQKRALTSAVLVATGASAYFTPGDEAVKDLYDVPVDDDSEMVDGEFEDIATPDTFPVDEPKTAAPLVDQPQPAPKKERRLDTTVGAPQNGKPQPAPTGWTEAQATAWVNRQIENGHSDVELRTALVVNRWGEWDGTQAEADAALARFVQSEIDAAKAEKATEG